MAIFLDLGRNIKRLTLIQTLVYQCCIHRSYPSLHTDSFLRQCSKGAMQNVSTHASISMIFMTAVAFITFISVLSRLLDSILYYFVH